MYFPTKYLFSFCSFQLTQREYQAKKLKLNMEHKHFLPSSKLTSIILNCPQ